MVTQVASIVAMNLALADGDDERGEELVVRNGQGNTRFHLVVGEVSLNNNVNNAVNVVEGGFAIVSLVVVVIFSVGWSKSKENTSRLSIEVMSVWKCCSWRIRKVGVPLSNQ